MESEGGEIWDWTWFGGLKVVNMDGGYALGACI